MSDDWTKEDQDKAVALRHEVVGELQRARRHNLRAVAWVLNKVADWVLWVEREGRGLMREGWH